MPDIILYSSRVCPFCHRTRLALLEKGLRFKLIEIDLNHKPEWFQEISPFGLVPALVNGPLHIWESAIINEYLEDIFPAHGLFPSDAGQRARARIWIDFANTRFIPVFYKLLSEKDPEKRPSRENELRESLEIMEKDGIGRLGLGGSYWLGHNISLVDLAIYPWFERWPVLEHYRSVFSLDKFPLLNQWFATMKRRSSVRECMENEDYYIREYQRYAEVS